jgi:hypothetical protein
LSYFKKKETWAQISIGTEALVGLSVGANEELVGVVVIRGASKHHLSIDATAKAVGNLGKVLGASCVVGFGQKL